MKSATIAPRGGGAVARVGRSALTLLNPRPGFSEAAKTRIATLAALTVRDRRTAVAKAAAMGGAGATLFGAALASMPPALAAALAALASIALASALLARTSRLPAVTAARTRFNDAVLSRVPSLHRPVATPLLLANAHVETIFAAKARKSPGVVYNRTLLTTADGGTVTIDALAAPPQGCAPLPDDAPVLLVLPGLTGGSHDTYVQYLAIEAAQAGMRAVVFNSRGTSDGPVTSPQYYSASFTGDLREVVAWTLAQWPASPLLAAGYSLGGERGEGVAPGRACCGRRGAPRPSQTTPHPSHPIPLPANILVNYLGEEGDKAPIAAAVSLCNPFDLVISDANFSTGFNRVYDTNLATSLRTIHAKHAHLWDTPAGKAKHFNSAAALQATTIRQFDDAITRVSFGWPSVEAYYAGSGSAARVPGVRVPLLCLQAEDDPIAPAAAIPTAALEANPHCVLVTTQNGGHLGWTAGPGGPRGAPWSDAPAIEFLYSALLELYREGRLPAGGRGGAGVKEGRAAVAAGRRA